MGLKKRVVYYAKGASACGVGFVKLRIKKKDMDFYKVRGYKVGKTKKR